MKAGITLLTLLILGCVGIGLWEVFQGYIASAVFAFLAACYMIAFCIVIAVRKKKKIKISDNDADEQKQKSKSTIGALVGITLLMLVIVGGTCASSVSSYQADQTEVRRVEYRISNIDKVSLYDHDDIQEALEAYNALPENLRNRVSNKDLLDKAQEQYDALLQQLAEECDATILKLKSKTVSFTKSFSDDMEDLYDNITTYNLQDRLEHYNDYSDMYTKYSKLRESHKHSCQTKITCDYCGGSGKCVVEFYEYGDWGEKTYSSYTCTYCNGSGGKTCPTCNGKGYYYTYDNG